FMGHGGKVENLSDTDRRIKSKASPCHSLLTPLKKIQPTFPMMGTPYRLFSSQLTGRLSTLDHLSPGILISFYNFS
uniref:Uncharacterized protein n=1 Tax=Zonotrichia albicollis TaxID=44394 RepID=A0A8D2NCP0_ZONAL